MTWYWWTLGGVDVAVCQLWLIRLFVRDSGDAPTTGDLAGSVLAGLFFGVYLAACWPVIVAGVGVYRLMDRGKLLHRLFRVGDFRRLSRAEKAELRATRIRQMEHELGMGDEQR